MNHPYTRIIEKKIFFSAIAILLLVLACELILSIGGYLYYDTQLNPESSPIEEDAFHILFLGESSTYGLYLDNPREESYPSQIERILQEKYPDKKIKTYNKGVCAIETTAILRNLDRNMLKYKPPLVILMAGNNENFVEGDYTSSVWTSILSHFKTYRLVASAIDIPRLNWVKQGDNDFIYNFDHKGKRSYSYKQYTPLSEVISNINTIIGIIHTYNSEVWLAGYLQPDPREKVNPILQKIAQENNIKYVGNYSDINFNKNPQLFAKDNWHPSKEGHKVIAEEVAKAIIHSKILENFTPK